MRGDLCHIVSPEKQESWDINEQLFSIFQPRKAENMSAAKQAGRPFPWRGGKGELFQKPSKGNQKLRIPLRGKTQATQSDQTGPLNSDVAEDQVWQRYVVCSESRSQQG